jgi:hypothetical protein
MNFAQANITTAQSPDNMEHVSAGKRSGVLALNLGLAILAVTLVSGCTRTVGPLESASSLPPAPAGNVSSQTLPPPPATNPNVATDINGNPINALPGQTIDGTTGLPIDQNQPTQNTQVAAVDSKPLDRGSVAGVWNVQVSGGTCRFATSFTRRSTHFQASPLRCPDPELSNVREWNVSGNQMVLYDQSGSAVARLFKTGTQRLDGKTSGGTAVTFSRD